MMKKEEIVIFPFWVERGGEREVKPLGTLNLIILKGDKASRLTKL